MTLIGSPLWWEVLEAGESLPAIVLVDGWDEALSGTHRIEAHRQLDLPIAAVMVSEEDYLAALYRLGLEEHDAYNADDVVAELVDNLTAE